MSYYLYLIYSGASNFDARTKICSKIQNIFQVGCNFSDIDREIFRDVGKFAWNNAIVLNIFDTPAKDTASNLLFGDDWAFNADVEVPKKIADRIRLISDIAAYAEKKLGAKHCAVCISDGGYFYSHSKINREKFIEIMKNDVEDDNFIGKIYSFDY